MYSKCENFRTHSTHMSLCIANEYCTYSVQNNSPSANVLFLNFIAKAGINMHILSNFCVFMRHKMCAAHLARIRKQRYRQRLDSRDARVSMGFFLNMASSSLCLACHVLCRYYLQNIPRTHTVRFIANER